MIRLVVKLPTWTVGRSSGCQFLACRQTVCLDSWLVIGVVCLDGQGGADAVCLDGWLVIGVSA